MAVGYPRSTSQQRPSVESGVDLVRLRNLYLRPVSYLSLTSPKEQYVILAVDFQGGIENAWSSTPSWPRWSAR